MENTILSIRQADSKVREEGCRPDRIDDRIRQGAPPGERLAGGEAVRSAGGDDPVGERLDLAGAIGGAHAELGEDLAIPDAECWRPLG